MVMVMLSSKKGLVDDELYTDWVRDIAAMIQDARLLSGDPEIAAELVDTLECPAHQVLGPDRAKYGTACYGECVIDKTPGSLAFIRLTRRLLRASYAVSEDAQDILRDARTFTTTAAPPPETERG